MHTLRQPLLVALILALGLVEPPGLRAYGSFSNDVGPIIAVVLRGTSIPFSATAVAQDVSLPSDTVTLPHPDTYRLSYCVRLAAATLAARSW